MKKNKLASLRLIADEDLEKNLANSEIVKKFQIITFSPRFVNFARKDTIPLKIQYKKLEITYT